MACVGWRRRWKHWGVGNDAVNYIYAAFMNMLFLRSVEELAYEVKLKDVKSRLQMEISVPTGLLLPVWCGSDNVSDGRFASGQEFGLRKSILSFVFVGMPVKIGSSLLTVMMLTFSIYGPSVVAICLWQCCFGMTIVRPVIWFKFHHRLCPPILEAFARALQIMLARSR